jgi:hypothetical protein
MSADFTICTCGYAISSTELEFLSEIIQWNLVLGFLLCKHQLLK